MLGPLEEQLVTDLGHPISVAGLESATEHIYEFDKELAAIISPLRESHVLTKDLLHYRQNISRRFQCTLLESKRRKENIGLLQSLGFTKVFDSAFFHTMFNAVAEYSDNALYVETTTHSSDPITQYYATKLCSISQNTTNRNFTHHKMPLFGSAFPIGLWLLSKQPSSHPWTAPSPYIRRQDFLELPLRYQRRMRRSHLFN